MNEVRNNKIRADVRKRVAEGVSVTDALRTTAYDYFISIDLARAIFYGLGAYYYGERPEYFKKRIIFYRRVFEAYDSFLRDSQRSSVARSFVSARKVLALPEFSGLTVWKVFHYAVGFWDFYNVDPRQPLDSILAEFRRLGKIK